MENEQFFLLLYQSIWEMYKKSSPLPKKLLFLCFENPLNCQSIRFS